MWNLTVKSLFARKLRLALTSIAIVLGVSFIVSSFVVADSLRSTFDDLVDELQGEVDLTVRAAQEFGNEDSRPRIDDSILPLVQDTEGVKAAVPNISMPGVVPITADGEPVESLGPPLLGVNWEDDPDLGQFIIQEGRAPEGPTEFALDKDAADEDDFQVGQTYTISSPTAGNREFELVGIFAFNSEDTDVLATLSAFDLDTAQDFLGFEGQFQTISVKVEDGVDRATVEQRLTDVLPAGVEAVDREVTVEEGRDAFGQISSVFGNILLAFAIITLVVSAFLINNTFQIVIGQRVKELALLRAIGATGRQVSRSVLLESFVIGVVSTVIGIGVGVLLSYGLRALFDAIGFSLPSGPLVMAPRTVIVAVVVGVGVTLLASLAPARKARRVPPIAAMRDDYQLAGTSMKRRLTIGVIVTAVGAVLMGWGLFGNLDTAPLLTVLSVGALAVFIGINLLSPLVARPVAKALGAPIQGVYKTTGRLSRENAARNPQRTSSTAAALMIGLALVSMASVVGASLRTTFLDIIGSAVTADYFIQPDSGGAGAFGGIPRSFSEELAEQPEIDSVVPYRFVDQGVQIDAKTKAISGTQLDTFSRHLDIDVQEGSLDDLGPNSLLVYEQSAEDHDFSVGDTVPVTFVDGQVEDFTIAAIYADASIMGNWVIDLEPFERHFPSSSDGFVSARVAEGVDAAAGQAAIDRVVANFPQIKAETKAEFEESTKQQLDSFLAVITGFLAFALLIALMGIANTLALSVFERTRELGLLRAVGMTRRQLRRMVRWEAAIIAVFGALMGVVLGIIFGVAAASAVPNSFIKTITIPYAQIIQYVVIAGFAGLIAAFFPARRAGKLNVLDAISHN
jgi:putative ABC transport system permease protein